MNLRQLEYFVEICDRGSMTRAAESLYVAQPALSQHIARLERELGITLLARSVKGTQPTAAGEELLRRARHILELVAETRQVLKSGTAVPQGDVVLGMPPSVSAILAVPLIVRLRADYPRVSLRIVESTSGYVLDWLNSGRINLGVLYGIQRAASITAEKLFEEELFLVRAPAGSKARNFPFRELPGCDLILPGRDHGLRDTLDRIAREQGVTLAPSVEIDALAQMKGLVKLGIGATVLSHAAVRDEIARGELEAIRITAPRISRAMYAAWPRDTAPTNAIRAVLDTLHACVAEMAAATPL